MTHALALGIHLLTVIFLVGIAGSAIVVAISFVEDFSILFSSDKEEHSTLPAPPRT